MFWMAMLVTISFLSGAVGLLDVNGARLFLGASMIGVMEVSTILGHQAGTKKNPSGYLPRPRTILVGAAMYTVLLLLLPP